MSELVAIVEALVEAGATPQMILAAVKANAMSRDDALAKRRASDAARQQAMRERRNNVTSRDVTVTVHETPLEQRVSPTPPSETQSPHTPSPPKGGSVPKFSVEFDRFWEAYPRKIGKGDARKAFAKALSRISGPDPPGVLLRALERVRPTWTDPRYIPHPSTWLNGERWEDEPESQILTFRPADGRSHPLRSDKLAAREANLARAFAGAEIAARGRREF